MTTNTKNKHLASIYIVRHGEAEWNVKHLVQSEGRGDTPLTKFGRKQADDLAKVLKGIPFDAVYSSHLKRALQTAQVIADNRDLKVKISSDLRERSFGKFVGMNVDDLLSLYKNFDDLTIDQKLNYKLDENEESFTEGYKRFFNALHKIATEYMGKNILIVTHGDMIRGLLIRNGYGDFKQVGGIDNCGYVKIQIQGQKIDIEKVVGLRSWQEKYPKK